MVLGEKFRTKLKEYLPCWLDKINKIITYHAGKSHGIVEELCGTIAVVDVAQ
jgi:hypothetical protein